MTKQFNIGLLLLLTFLLLCLMKSWSHSLNDFGNYYYGGKLFLDNSFNEQVYNADYCNTTIKDRYDESYFGAFYPNPPSLAMLYSPSTLFEARLAKLLLNIFSIGIFILALFKLFSHWKIPQLYLALLPIVFCYPLHNCVLFGQPYLIMIGLLIFGFLHLQSRTNNLGYLAWPMTILLKVSPIVLMSIPLLERRFKDLFTYSGVIMTGVLVSFIWIEPSTWIYYTTQVLSKVSDGILYNSYAISAESMPVLLRHLFLHEPMLNPSPLINSAMVFTVIFACTKAVFYTIGIRASSLSQVPTGIKVSLWLILLLLLSPNISSYGLTYLIIPYFYLIHSQQKIDIPASVLLFATCTYKQSWFEDLPLLFQFGKLIGVGMFLIYVLYRTGLVRHLLDKWTIAIFTLLTLVFILLGGKRDTESIANYALPKTPKALLHQFGIKENGKVKMVNHTIGGYDTITQSLPINTVQSIRRIHADELGGFDNIFSESVAKDKPIILADENIYYMTDEERAPGFYTIKQVPIKQISKD